MLSFLQAIPVIGQLINLITLVINGVVYAGKWTIWKLRLNKLLGRKDEILNADEPIDWVSIFKRKL